jgi:hypothetical protein
MKLSGNPVFLGTKTVSTNIFGPQSCEFVSVAWYPGYDKRCKLFQGDCTMVYDKKTPDLRIKPRMRRLHSA